MTRFSLRRLLIVLSVIWCLGLSAYFWISEMNQKQDWLSGMIHLCNQGPDPAQFQPCYDGVRASFDQQVAEQYHDFLPMAGGLTLISLGLLWLVGGGVLAILRWIGMI